MVIHKKLSYYSIGVHVAQSVLYRIFALRMDQCWVGIDKKHTCGYRYPSNQERPHGYGDWYNMCCGTSAMP